MTLRADRARPGMRGLLRSSRWLAASVGVAAVALGCLTGSPVSASPAAAAAHWTKPERLTKLDYYFHAIDSAVASDGTAALVFDKGIDDSTRVQARVRSASTGTWGRRAVLVRRPGSVPVVAVDEGGAVAAAWLSQDRSMLVVRRHDGDGWDRRIQVAVDGMERVADIELNPNGDVAVIMQKQLWSEGVTAAVLPQRGRWTVMAPMATAELLVARRALLSDDGQLTIIATEARSSDTDEAVVVGRLDSTGRWETSRLAPPEGGRVSDMTAEMGPDGTTAIVWTESDWSVRWQRVVLAVADPGEPFERRVLDGSAERDCWYPISCAGVGFAADSRLMLVWTTGGEGSGVLAAERSGDGTWSEAAAVPLDLDVPGSEVLSVAVAPDGATVIAATTDFASCPTLGTCTSIGVPDHWPPNFRQYSWIAAGPGGSVSTVHGERLCSGRCLGRPYWSTWRSG